jgi:glycosyltransferase involved in cell wall biosynthesis
VKSLHFVVPARLDDVANPTGGNVYDHRIHRDLVSLGWHVTRLAAPGSWPGPDAAAEHALARMIGSIPHGAVVLVDDLIACAVPDIVIAEADRLRLLVLAHNAWAAPPPGAGADGAGGDAAQAGQAAVFAAARYVLTTSSWTRDQILERHGLPPHQVVVAEPGVDPATLARGTPQGGGLLCVAALAAHKGQDVLLDALGHLRELPWRCVCVGDLDREPAFVEDLRHRVLRFGIGDRVTFAGVQTGRDLERAYAAADVLVLPSYGETYGMVVTEALARGLPVIATDVGGLPEALGRTRAGQPPGLLIPAGDSAALATALERWLTDPALRRQLRQAALERRSTLTGWDVTTRIIADVLTRARS